MRWIILIVMLLMLPIVSAANETITIYADYKVDSIYTNSNAKISILNPTGNLSINNVSMIELAKGTFKYIYSCNVSGTYNAKTVFLNKTTDKELGSDNKDFTCGNKNGFNLGSCPTAEAGMWGLWIFFVIVCLLGITGIVTRYPILTGIAGGMFVLLAFTFWNCSDLMGYLNSFLAVAFGMIAFAQKN